MSLLKMLVLAILTGSYAVTSGQVKTTAKYNCDVFANANFDLKVFTLKADDSVIVNSYYFRTKAYFISSDTIQGYVYWDNIRNTWELSNMRNDAENTAIKGQYWIDMTKREASIALGEPDQKSTKTGRWGTSDVWSYHRKGLVLVFENGKLTAYRHEDRK